MATPLLASKLMLYPGLAADGAVGPLAVLLLGTGLAVLLIWLRPLWLLRAFLWLLTHSIYRLQVFGRENVPAQGAALLVCNHVSYLDGFLLLAAQRRFIRFLIFAGWTEKWGIRHLLRWAGVIPIDGGAGPRAIVRSLQLASEALKRGELVCIFAEGRFTRTGFLLPFHRGFEQIVKRCPAPIIPVCLDQLWGSIFSYRGGKLLWKWPQELPYPVTVAFGQPMPADSSAGQVRMAVQKLSADCAIVRSQTARPVHRQFIRQACRHPFRPCLTDSLLRKVVNYGEALVGATLLSRRLQPLLGDSPMVGVWLPSSVGGALANIALAFLGKTSVNLNYTAGMDNVQSAIRQCQITRVISAQRFLERMPLAPGPGVEIIHLDKLRETISRLEQLGALLAVLLLPRFLTERLVVRPAAIRPQDTATVIFSSGSTGEPKGIVLSFRNIAANTESMIQAIDLGPRDVVLGVLPFFHSFGYTVTLWAPLLIGASTVYHADPRQAKEIGELCKKYRATIFLITPTFLRFCLRRSPPDSFHSLRLLMCGAEKMPLALAREFQEKFGILPLEGYGCTELSPAAAANVPDQELDGFKQIGNKPGTIGHPLPGIAARIVNPDTFEPVPVGQEGMLLIYGANVMEGYLHRPDLTRAAIRDGWYVTGDMARMDEDGFLTITGRLSRFAKIGGEMVPLEKIEEELHHVLGTNERVCAVAAVPDDKKGERLLVLHTSLNGAGPPWLVEELGKKGLPNLWIPDERDFHEVPEIPVLGSGKLDLKKLQDLARGLAGGA